MSKFIPLVEIARRAGKAANILRKHHVQRWRNEGLACKDTHGRWLVDDYVIHSIVPTRHRQPAKERVREIMAAAAASVAQPPPAVIPADAAGHSEPADEIGAEREEAAQAAREKFPAGAYPVSPEIAAARLIQQTIESLLLQGRPCWPAIESLARAADALVQKHKPRRGRGEAGGNVA